MKSITLNLVVLVYTSKTGGIMPILTLMNPTTPPPPPPPPPNYWYPL